MPRSTTLLLVALVLTAGVILAASFRSADRRDVCPDPCAGEATIMTMPLTGSWSHVAFTVDGPGPAWIEARLFSTWKYDTQTAEDMADRNLSGAPARLSILGAYLFRTNGTQTDLVHWQAGFNGHGPKSYGDISFGAGALGRSATVWTPSMNGGGGGAATNGFWFNPGPLSAGEYHFVRLGQGNIEFNATLNATGIEVTAVDSGTEGALVAAAWELPAMLKRSVSLGFPLPVEDETVQYVEDAAYAFHGQGTVIVQVSPYHQLGWGSANYTLTLPSGDAIRVTMAQQDLGHRSISPNIEQGLLQSWGMFGGPGAYQLGIEDMECHEPRIMQCGPTFVMYDLPIEIFP